VKVKKNKIILSETEIKRQIKGFLKLLKIKNWHNLQGLGCFKGLPDREGVYKCRHFYIEVKSARGKLSDYQEAFKRAVEEENEKVFVVKSVEEFIDQWDKWTAQIEQIDKKFFAFSV